MAVPCVFSLCLFAFLAVLLSARHGEAAAELGESEIASWNNCRNEPKRGNRIISVFITLYQCFAIGENKKERSGCKNSERHFLRERGFSQLLCSYFMRG